MILFSQNNTEIEYHSELGLLEVRWIKILQEDQLSVIWAEILKYASQFKLQYLLFDASHMDSVQFLYDEHTAAILKLKLPSSSLSKIAIVTSEAVNNTASIENSLMTSVGSSNCNCQFKLFHHHYEAMDWLLEFVKLDSSL